MAQQPGVDIANTVYDPIYKMVEGENTYTFRLGTNTEEDRLLFEGTLGVIPDYSDMNARRSTLIFWNVTSPKPPYPVGHRECWLVFEVNGTAVGSFMLGSEIDADGKEHILSNSTAILESERGKKYSTKMFNLLGWMAKSSGDGHNVTDIQQDILASAKGALKEAHKRGATLVQTDRDRFNQPSHRLTVDTANGEAFRTSQGLSSTNFSIEERFTNITESKWGIGPVLEYIKQQEDIPAWNADWV